MSTTLAFVLGTLELRGVASEDAPACCVWDERTACHRAQAIDYARIVLDLRKKGIACEDRARAYTELSHGPLVHRAPRHRGSRIVTSLPSPRPIAAARPPGGR